jgi:hypothetical protein
MTDYVANVLGPAITRTASSDVIAGIVGERVGSSEKGKAWRAPMVILDEQSTIGGPGSGDVANARLWQQESLVTFRCFGLTDVQADQLARAVYALWHECGRDGPIVVGSTRIRNAWVAVKSGAVRAPKTTWPFATVRVRILAAGRPID